MALFKSGNNTANQYASYSNEQLIDIVTDKAGNHSPDAVEAARRALLVRGLDYRTKEQKAADQAVNVRSGHNTSSPSNTSTATFPAPRVRINRQRPQRPFSGSASSSGLKSWHWIWIILTLVRVIACLARHN